MTTSLERAWAGTEVADPAVVAALAETIRGLLARKNLEAHLEVGALLFDRCYGSQTDRFGASATVDAIAREPDAPMSRASLYRAVQLVVQWRAHLS